MQAELLQKIAYAHMGEKSSHDWKDKGNKFYHGQRVAKLVILLRKQLYPKQAQWDACLTLAAWFHDICNGAPDHARAGADVTRRLLDGICAPALLDKACGIIAVHDDRNAGQEDSALLMLHQDADLLDHFGTQEIWMECLYAVPHGRTMDGVADWMLGGRPGEDAKHRGKLHFAYSRRVYDEKSAFAQAFSHRLRAEGAGELFDAADWDTAYREHLRQLRKRYEKDYEN